MNSYFMSLSAHGYVIEDTDIITKTVKSVTDNRDGSTNLFVSIYDNQDGKEYSEITFESEYTIYYKAIDLAGNIATATTTLVVDDTPPIIHYNYSYTAQTPMYIDKNTITPDIIVKDDIRKFYIEYVEDAVDGIIATSAVTITISSGVTTFTGITEIGQYTVNFLVYDRSLNRTTGTTDCVVKATVPPEIIFNDVFYYDIFEMYTGVSESQILYYAVSAVTDNYDGDIPITNVVISGASFPIEEEGEYTITFSIDDSSGNNTTETKTLEVIDMPEIHLFFTNSGHSSRNWNTFFGKTFLLTNMITGTTTEFVLYGGRNVKIGVNKFINDTTLLNIHDNGSINGIYGTAFIGCTQLKGLDLPYVNSIGNGAFYNCDSLSAVNFLSATSVGSGAFYNCSSLLSVSLPYATTVGNQCFQGCSSLTFIDLSTCVELGSSVEDNMVFYGLSGLTGTLIVDQSLETCRGVGLPDGDIIYLSNNNTGYTITYV